MKFERIKKSHTKGIVIGVISVSALILLAVYAGSRAKYKVTQSIPLVNGTINYEIGDFNVVAMYTSEDGTNYTEVDKMPESGYEINEEKSYCKVNGEKDPNAKLYTNSDGEYIVGNLQKNSKCYVYFDKKLCNGVGCKTILAETKPKVCSNVFTKPSTADEGICADEEEDGMTYYYRGNVTNNWVQFAGFYWRIIRINGDGSIRMIYNGTSTTTTGTGTQLQTSAYNTNYNDNAYVGYMYGSTGASTYAATHANTNNSTIKGIVDNWYKTNIADKGYGNKVSTDAGFCNDRSIASSSQTWWTSDTKKGYGTNATAYGPFSRAITTSNSYNSTQTPKFGCSQSADLFTVSSSSKGNKKLTYPVGLITMDEVIYGGGFGGTANSSYYLYTNQAYWTMSPRYMNANGGTAYVFRVYSDGTLGNGYVGNTNGVRPVINLASDVKLTGSGTTSSPYTVSSLSRDSFWRTTVNRD